MKLDLQLNADELWALAMLLRREADKLKSRAPDLFPYGHGTTDTATVRLAKRLDTMLDRYWREQHRIRREAQKRRENAAKAKKKK